MLLLQALDDVDLDFAPLRELWCPVTDQRMVEHTGAAGAAEASVANVHCWLRQERESFEE